MSTSVLSSFPRVIFFSPYRSHPKDYHDQLGANMYSKPRFAWYRHSSSGLRFLKQNIPQIEICEFPLWEEYVAKLKEGWDIAGFGFYQNDVGKFIRMAEEARRQGVKEIWAGNYGALDQEVPKHADRIFKGYAETQVADALGVRLDEIVHPPWPAIFRIVPSDIGALIFGILHSQRGCYHRCTFCQTPAFSPKPTRLSVDSIERLLRHYKRNGINEILLTDEYFGLFPNFTKEIIDLMHKYGFKWTAQTRISTYLEHAEEWNAKGLRIVLLGVESVSSLALSKVIKEESVSNAERAARVARRYGHGTIAFYMIGFQDDTVESVRRDLLHVRSLGFGAVQLCIMTPFPGTPLWQEVDSNYGIWDKDYTHFNAKHLVWNHPHISSREMDYLLKWGFATLNQPLGTIGRMVLREVVWRAQRDGLRFPWRQLVQSVFVANTYNERKVELLPAAGKPKASLQSGIQYGAKNQTREGTLKTKSETLRSIPDGKPNDVAD